MLVFRAIIVATGLNFKLDVGTFRSWMQVACQRYRQNWIDAKSFKQAVASVKAGLQGVALNLFGTPATANLVA